jgi:hypothetical protein
MEKQMKIGEKQKQNTKAEKECNIAMKKEKQEE